MNARRRSRRSADIRASSWTEDPITVDPDEDRSIEAVIARSAGSPGSHEDPA